MSLALSFQSGALGSYTQYATTIFGYGNESFHYFDYGIPAAPGSIVSGSSGVASIYDQSFANASYGFTAYSAVVQDYLTFHARAYVTGFRNGPGNSYEYFQSFATGQLVETLTIPAPPGVTPGSIGSIQPGWDVTGSTSPGVSGSAYMAISAHTSAPLSGTSSNTVSIGGNGHFDLVDPIKFLYDTPFVITIDLEVFAAVGYDYTNTAPPTTFADTASAEFLNTAILTTAIVRDAFGNVRPDAVISTSSGLPFPIVVPPPSCAGDVNGDGFTNSADFNILASHFGQSVPPGTLGDLSGDGLVNSADFNVLAGDFGCVG